MAPRIGYTLDALRDMAPGACDSDLRLVWKSGDRGVLGLMRRGDNEMLAQFCVSGGRELQLLGLQILALVEEMQRDSRQRHEEML